MSFKPNMLFPAGGRRQMSVHCRSIWQQLRLLDREIQVANPTTTRVIIPHSISGALPAERATPARLPEIVDQKLVRCDASGV